MCACRVVGVGDRFDVVAIAPTLEAGLTLFAREALGGAVLGLAIGTLVNAVLHSIDDYRVEVLITLATVVGGYALAQALETSGPLAMVAIGLLVGNEGRALAMSDRTRQHLDIFWQMLDEILNSVLFVLIGLECAMIEFPAGSWRAGLVVVLLALVLVLALTGPKAAPQRPGDGMRHSARCKSGRMGTTWVTRIDHKRSPANR